MGRLKILEVHLVESHDIAMALAAENKGEDLLNGMELLSPSMSHAPIPVALSLNHSYFEEKENWRWSRDFSIPKGN